MNCVYFFAVFALSAHIREYCVRRYAHNYYKLYWMVYIVAISIILSCMKTHGRIHAKMWNMLFLLCFWINCNCISYILVVCLKLLIRKTKCRNAILNITIVFKNSTVNVVNSLTYTMDRIVAIYEWDLCFQIRDMCSLFYIILLLNSTHKRRRNAEERFLC